MNTKSCFVLRPTGPDGVVAMTSANGLVKLILLRLRITHISHYCSGTNIYEIYLNDWQVRSDQSV